MQNRALLFIVLALTLSITGCAKKSETSAPQGTGFDSISTTDELAQLPTTSSSMQPAPVEALPVETSPVTQGSPVVAAPVAPVVSAVPAVVDAAVSSLSHDKKIQTALKNAGYYQGNIDGKIGPASKKAIEAFQRDKGLKVDGKVGPKTWAALEAYLTGAVSSAPASIGSEPIAQ